MWTSGGGGGGGGGGEREGVSLEVTRVRAEGPLLRLTGVYSKMNARALERHLAEAAPSILSSPPPPARYLRPGLVVAVVGGPVGLRRAALLGANPPTARFIDDGEESAVRVSDVRLLDSAPDAIRATPPQAIDLYLSRVAHPGLGWDPRPLAYVENLLVGSEVSCRVEFKAGDRSFATVRFEGGDLAEFLERAGLVSRADPRGRVAAIEEAAALASRPPPPLRSKLARNVAAPRPLNRAEAPEEAPLAYRSRQLELHSRHLVRVTHAEGPELFAVRLESDDRSFAALEKRIEAAPRRRIAEPPTIGTVCLGRLPETGSVHRAIVSGLRNGKCVLFFVDVGATELVRPEDVYRVPAELVTPSVFAHRFRLSGAKELPATEEVRESFRALVRGKILALKTVPPDGPPLVQYAELELDGRDVGEALAEGDPCAYAYRYATVDASSPRGRVPVIVSFVDSCANFFVRLSENARELEALAERVRRHCETVRSYGPREIARSTACCARYPDDDAWYRARVLDAKGDRVVVFYVDYGNEQELEPESIKPISRSLMTPRAQAIRCSLRGFEDLPFDARLSSGLEELTVERELEMDVRGSLGDGTLLVDLFDESGSPANVAERLLRFRDAVRPEAEVEAPREEAEPPVSSFGRRGGSDRFESARRSDRNEERDFQRDRRRDGGRPNGRSGPKSGVADRPRARDDGPEDDRRNAARENRHHNKENVKRPPRQYRKKDKDASDGVASDARPNKINKFQNKGPIDQKRNVSGGFAKQNHRNWDNSSNNSRGSFKKYTPNFARKTNEERFPIPKPAKTLSDPAPPDARFAEYEPRENERVRVSWFIDPENFYVQILSFWKEFADLMSRIPTIYEGIPPMSNYISNGTAVLAQYPADNALFRAEIVEKRDSNNYVVYFVDFGNKCLVNSRKIWRLSRELLNLPKLAMKCSLKDISPANGKWSKDYQEDKFFSDSEYVSNFISKGFDSYTVSLHSKNYPNVDEALVNAGLATIGSAEMIPRYKPEPIDLKLIIGQNLYCKIQQINSMSEFYMCLDPFADCDENIDGEYVTNKPLKCTLHNFNPDSSELIIENEDFKSLNDCFVFAYIDDVCDNVLVVTLYDCTTGYKINCFSPDEGAYGSIPVICSHPVFNDNFGSSFASHVESINEIYFQRNKNSDLIYKLLQLMFNYYEGNDNARQLEQLETDCLCAAKSNDANWYRARVLRVTPDECEIFYIDYGNKETVPKTSIRALDVKFNKYYEQAISCVLGISSRSDSAVGELIEIINEQELQVKLSLNDMGWMSTIMINDINVIDKLSVNIKNPDEDVESKNEDIKEKSISVVVSHVDTPGQFWLQLSSDLDKIDKLNSKLQDDAVNFEDLSDCEIGKNCIVKYSADELYYRAVILDSDSDIITVRFIDFGNTDVLDNSPGNMKCIPKDLFDIQPYSIKCSVNAIPTGMGEWTEQATALFNQTIQNKDVPIEAVIILKDATTYVDLYINNSNVTETLVKAGFATLVANQNNGELPTGFASHINSPSEFWIQLESSVNDLELVSEQLINAEDFPPVTEIEEEVICAAKFPEDGCWYRAKIIIHGSDGTEVLFMDYGNASLTDDLRTLPENLKNMPALSRKCALQKPSNIKNWSKEAESKFAELAADGATIFQVTFIASGDISIVELYLNNKPITEELVALCNAQDNVSIQKVSDQENIVPVCISFFENLKCFWIQYDSSSDKLTSIANALDNTEKCEELKEPKEGDLCISLFDENSKWYRSKIISVSESGVELLHIDYGTTAMTANIKMIPEHIKDIPPLAIRCCLQTDVEIDNKIQEKLTEFSNEHSQQLYIKLLNSSTDINSVDLYIKEKDLFINLMTYGRDVDVEQDAEIDEHGENEVQNFGDGDLNEEMETAEFDDVGMAPTLDAISDYLDEMYVSDNVGDSKKCESVVNETKTTIEIESKIELKADTEDKSNKNENKINTFENTDNDSKVQVDTSEYISNENEMQVNSPGNSNSTQSNYTSNEDESEIDTSNDIVNENESQVVTSKDEVIDENNTEIDQVKELIIENGKSSETIDQKNIAADEALEKSNTVEVHNIRNDSNTVEKVDTA